MTRRSQPSKVWRKNVQGPGNRSGKGPGVSDDLTSRLLGLEHGEPESGVGEKELEGARCPQGQS